MYGIPENIDLSGLLGQSVIGILVGKYCSNIQFDDAIIGSLDGGCEVLSGNKSKRDDGSPDTAKNLLALVNRTVERVTIKANESIRIDFDNDFSIILRDELEKFESFTIEINGKLVLIV